MRYFILSPLGLALCGLCLSGCPSEKPTAAPEQSAAGSLVYQDTDLVLLPTYQGSGEVPQLRIENNPNLKGVTGLRDLVVVSGDLSIRNNPSLAGLRGLGKLKQVGGSVTVTDCPKLLDCEVYFMVQRLRAQRPDIKLTISGNKEDSCTSKLDRLQGKAKSPPASQPASQPSPAPGP